MAANHNATEEFQLTSPVTKNSAESSSKITEARCAENEEQDDSAGEERRQLFNPTHGEDRDSERTNVFCQKFSAVKWKKVFAVAVVLVDFCLIGASLSLIGAFFTTKSREKGASPFQIGIIVGITPFTLTIFAPFFGYLLPKLGFRFSFGVGLTIVGVTYLAIGPTIFLPSGWPFIFACSVLRFIEGIGCSLYYTTAYTIATEIFPNSMGFVVGMIEVGAGLGYACGPTVGGYLYLAGGYLTPFTVVGALCLVCLIPSMLFISATKKKRQLISLKVVAKLINSFIFFLLLLSVIIQMAALGFIIATLAIFYEEEFSLTPDKIGLGFLADSLFYVIFAPIMGKIADKTNPRVLIIIGLSITGIGFLLLGPSSICSLKPILWVTIIALCIIGVGTACGLVAVFPDVTSVAKSILESELEDDMNSLPSIIAGLISGTVSFGEFLGPVIGGVLTQFMEFQESTTVYGELVLALMFIILGVTLIDKFHKLSSEKSLKVI